MLEKGMIKDGSKVIIQKEIVGESEEEKKERLKREEEQLIIKNQLNFLY